MVLILHYNLYILFFVLTFFSFLRINKITKLIDINVEQIIKCYILCTNFRQIGQLKMDIYLEFLVINIINNE